MASLAVTQACEDRDFAEWHRGCAWCAVWVVGLDVWPVKQRVDALRAVAQPWLLPRYARQPHLTLAYRGLMADPQQGHPAAEFGVPQLLQDVARLKALHLGPVTISVQGIGSFSTVPYLAVADSQPLQRLHRGLMGDVAYPGWQFVPHVTLGHYARSVPMQEVLQPLRQAAAAWPAHALQIDTLQLVRYRSQDIAGPLTVEGCWDMRLQRYVPSPQALLT